MNKQPERKDIVVIAPDRETMNLYSSHLSLYKDFTLKSYFSIEDFNENKFNSRSYVGFIVDLRNILKANPGAKEAFYHLIEAFPVIRISHSIDKKIVKGNIRDKNFKDKALFEYFLNQVCRDFAPRGIRAAQRKKIYLNVYMEFPGRGSGKERIKANSTDISELGGFFTSSREVQTGDELHLFVKEISDQSPVQCTVKWTLPWGASIKHIPGFGVVFNRMSTAQKKELTALLRMGI
jgi:hypothetical protein